MLEVKNLAVLIDADNTQSDIVEGLFDEIAKYGTASIRKIYGDWSSPHLQSWRDILLTYAITPVQQFTYIKDKDTTDMQLIIDAMDMLYSKTLDGFFIISSSSDFSPLVSRIRANGLTVFGIGNKETPEAFRQACNKFIYTDILVKSNKHDSYDQPKKGPEDQEDSSSNAMRVVNQTQTEIQPKEILQSSIQRQPIEGKLKDLLLRAVEESDNESGWVHISNVAGYLNKTQPDFDSRSYGYKKFSLMLKEIPELEFDVINSGLYCRKVS